jgi:hypothetical protein
LATKSQYNWGIIILGIIALAAITNVAGYWKLPGAATGPGGPPVTGVSQAGSAFCPATSTLAPPTSPPTGCYNQAQILSIKLQDFYASAALTASAYSCKLFVLTPTGWASPEVVAAGAAPTTCTSGLTYLPGTQITVEVCKDTTPACTTADYTAQKTVRYCPLPSVIGSGVCGSGAGAGVVPFSTTPSASTAPTAYFSLPIVIDTGQALANNSPDCISAVYSNGTATPAAPCTSAGSSNAYVKNCTTGASCVAMGGSTVCTGAPCAGYFTVTENVLYGTAGTLPTANPWGNGFTTYTPVDLQSGLSARGPLQVALVMEVKATTGTDMCTPSGASGTLDTVLGVSPQVLPKNSATDVFYVWILPDSAVTKANDASGTNIQVPSLTTQATSMSFNCNPVYTGGSTDVVQITQNLYTYFSIQYFKAYTSSLNPEVSINSSSGLALNNVINVKQ